MFYAVVQIPLVNDAATASANLCWCLHTQLHASTVWCFAALSLQESTLLTRQQAWLLMHPRRQLLPVGEVCLARQQSVSAQAATVVPAVLWQLLRLVPLLAVVPAQRWAQVPMMWTAGLQGTWLQQQPGPHR